MLKYVCDNDLILVFRHCKLWRVNRPLSCRAKQELSSIPLT